MKKIFLIIVALVSSSVFLSCEEDRVVFDNVNGGSVASFASSGFQKGITLTDPTTFTHEIVVNVTTVSNVDRTFVLKPNHLSTDPIASYYSINPTSLVIKAGEYNGKVLVTFNPTNIPNKLVLFNVTFTLDKLDGASVSKDLSKYALSFFTR